jgi:nitrogen regulatory protein PII
MAKIELICPEDWVAGVKKAILKHAGTGLKGDGLISISAVNEAINSRTERKE